jgi:hypothetical protein
MSRQLVIWLGLAATLMASAWLAQRPDEETPAAAQAVVPALVRPRLAVQQSAATVVPAASSIASAPPRKYWRAVPAQAVAAWGAPPPPPPPPATAVATAPARVPPPKFGYTWIGQLDDGASVQVLLDGPQRSFGARVGEVLDGTWRIDRVANTRLQLTWLPTGEAVTVDAR